MLISLLVRCGFTIRYTRNPAIANAVFQPDRPDYHYMHFATGRHACYGRYISRIQVPQILKPLLKLEGLRATGAPEYDGTFPETLRVAADI